jgi:hypothetical protein
MAIRFLLKEWLAHTMAAAMAGNKLSLVGNGSALSE